MGVFIDWLLHDDQKDLFEFLVALSLNLLFLELAALVLWPLGRLPLAIALAKGFGVLWIAVWATAALANILQRAFRVNMYDRATAYVVAGLATGGGLQMGWSAFAALTVSDQGAGASFWTAAILAVVGALACLAAYYVVSSVYQGAIYRLVNLPLALISFLVFSVWPASARALYGWFFQLF